MTERLLVLLGLVGGCGLLLLAGWLLLLPVSRSGLWTVIRARDGAEGLEQQIRGLVWLHSWGLLRCPVVVADAGLNERGRALVCRLAERWPQVILCGEGQLEHIVK